MRIQRGDVKTHEVPPHGQISKLVLEEDYGIITSADNREVFFHRNSVIDADFDDLAIGAEVRFTEQQDEQGARASTVHVIGKHHIVG